jgi:dTDP-4-amino-4,6-dideoxygalactose transaminase
MEHDIESGISYIPCHHFSLFQNEETKLPITDVIFEEVLCLPMHFELTNDDVKAVCNEVKSFLKK